MINRVENVTDEIQIKNCIISVADKRGCMEFVESLCEILPEIRIFSTGGTYAAIRENWKGKENSELINIEDFTGQPEMQGGLVKTLDFKIYTGILSEPGNADHRENIIKIGGTEFDMIVVNLYPFKETVSKKECTIEDARSNIDIGGPCMLRASAKNFLRVASVCDPEDYKGIIKELRESRGRLCLDTRLKLAKKAFHHTAEYDLAIVDYLRDAEQAWLPRAYTINKE